MSTPFYKTARMFTLSVVLAASAFLLSSCNSNEDSGGEVDTKVKSTTVGGLGNSNKMELDSEVLVTVNGEPITAEELASIIDKTFSGPEQLMSYGELTSKVLESMVASRAMKQVVQKSMTEQYVQELNLKVKAYEEELYVKEYMQRYVQAQPVTKAMVEQYYQDNPEQFGGGTVKVFERLSSDAAISEAQRDKVINGVDAIKASKSWPVIAKNNSFGLKFNYVKSRAERGLIDQRMASIIKPLELGETSPVMLNNGAIEIYRVVLVESLIPRPMAEVSTEIRKTLAPLQLKIAVKKAVEKVKSEAVIKYTDK